MCFTLHYITTRWALAIYEPRSIPLVMIQILSILNWICLFSNAEFPTTSMEMQAVADIFDRDGDGFIDYKEFVGALKPDRLAEVAFTIHIFIFQIILCYSWRLICASISSCGKSIWILSYFLFINSFSNWHRKEDVQALTFLYSWS